MLANDSNMAINFTIELINAIDFRLNLPSFILITLLLPFGAVANVLTLFFFVRRETRSNLRILFIFLAIIDLLCCILTAPLIMVDLLLPRMHPSRALCKMEVFLVYFCNICCHFTLIVLAAERYNFVCRPSRRQLTLFQTKKIIAAVVGVSVFFSLPMSLVVDRITYLVTNNIYAYTCMHTLPPLWYIYEWTLFAIFFGSLIVIFTLYYLVWKTNRAVEQDEQAEPIESVNTDLRTKQINRTLLGISILYVVSLAPYIIMNNVSWSTDPESWESWVMFQMFMINLWIVNCTGKPIVYAIFYTRFREYIKGIFRRSQKVVYEENVAANETED